MASLASLQAPPAPAPDVPVAGQPAGTVDDPAAVTLGQADPREPCRKRCAVPHCGGFQREGFHDARRYRRVQRRCRSAPGGSDPGRVMRAMRRCMARGCAAASPRQLEFSRVVRRRHCGLSTTFYYQLPARSDARPASMSSRGSHCLARVSAANLVRTIAAHRCGPVTASRALQGATAPATSNCASRSREATLLPSVLPSGVACGVRLAREALLPSLLPAASCASRARSERRQRIVEVATSTGLMPACGA